MLLTIFFLYYFHIHNNIFKNDAIHYNLSDKDQ